MDTSLYPREVLEFIMGPPDRPEGNPEGAAHAELRWQCGCTAFKSGPEATFRVQPCDEHRPEFEESIPEKIL